MEITLINDIVIIFGLAIGVLFLCHRVKVPAIVGYLLTGVVVGPHGLGLISNLGEVEILAEVGVVLLLFTIGIEFSLKSLLQIKRLVIGGGSLQVLLTFFIGFVIAKQLGQTSGESVFMAFLLSLSSTAIVLKLLQERAEVDSPYGRTGLGILIFQDIVVVPMMLVVPLLAGGKAGLGGNLFVLLAKGVGVIALAMVSAQWIVPRLLYQISRTRSRELFLLSVVAICFAVAWLTSQVGLSLALGAFLAGLIISESEYSHQALSNILPFRDVSMSFFFVSIGMLLEVGFLFKQPGLVILIALSVLILKAIIAGLATALLGFAFRTAILAGLALSQVGEFSFILSRSGVEHGLLSGTTHQLFLAVSVLTMAATPFIIALAPRLADFALRLPLPGVLKTGLYPVSGIGDDKTKERLRDHLIVIGFGVNGRNVARAARIAHIPYLIIEMNPQTVRDEKAKGEPIHYGDSVQEAVLEAADIETARVVVVAISDPVATRQIIAVARRLNPKVYIIARTRYLQEMKPLYELGADEVIPEEFETSVEIFTRILMKYLVPRDEIEKLIAEVRADGYQMLRTLSKESVTFSDLEVHALDIEISAFRVAETSSLVGSYLSEIELRRRYGVTVLVIRRDSQTLINPGGDTSLCANDLLLIMGPPDKLANIVTIFSNPEGGG